jgi:hypothetical protein
VTAAGLVIAAELVPTTAKLGRAPHEINTPIQYRGVWTR